MAAARAARRLPERAPACLIAMVVALGAVAGAAPRVSVAAASTAPSQDEPPLTYRLVQNWSGRPWGLIAGHYGQAADISSDDSGTEYVLDSRHGAIHVVDSQGTPLRVFRLANSGRMGDRWWTPIRLDVRHDGTIAVLFTGADHLEYGLTRVDLVRPDGITFASYEFPPRGGTYNDIAIDDQSFYLTRTLLGGIFSPGGDVAVDQYGLNGDLLEVIQDPRLTYPVGVDVASTGTVYVINRLLNPGGEGPPGATPTPEPSLLGVDQAAPTPVEGVLIFGADHKFASAVPFGNAEDVAVGPAGVFVSRHVEIFRLGQDEPLFSGPTGRVVAAYFGRTVFHLDAPVWGGIAASVDHCYTQGVAIFRDPRTAPMSVELHGALDGPEMEGPVYPIRISADKWLGAMSGRYNILGDRPDQYYTTSDSASEYQVVQHWSGDGDLQDQLGLCSGAQSWWVKDLAVDGDVVYTVDPSTLQARPDDGFPTWRYWPGELVFPDGASRLRAVAADDGTIAVLDTGAESVVLVDGSGQLMGSFSYAGLVNGVPGDIALDGDRVYLAETGSGRVVVAARDGTLVGEWTGRDPILALDTGPDGNVYVLGRDGWGFRYAPDGQLQAAWRLPSQRVWPLDITVDETGRVYVSYDYWEGDPNSYQLLDAGIWAFEPVVGPKPPPPAPADACVATPDKWADRRVVQLGESVHVTLKVAGQCPGHADPLQVMLVVDNSRSMNYDDAGLHALDGAQTILEALDPASAEAGLVTFSDAAGLMEPLTRDHALLAQRLAGLAPWGDTLVSTGLTRAYDELTGPRGNPEARRAVVLLTDGVLKDDPTAIAQQMAEAGIELYVVVYETWEWPLVNRDQLAALAGAASHVLVEPPDQDLSNLARGMARYTSEDGLFQTITVSDVIPSNMDYLGTADPPATVNGDTLVWQLSDVRAADPIYLEYDLLPLEVGDWPTNVRADAVYTDATGYDGQLVFPVPMVRVWDVATLDHHAYLPASANKSCRIVGKPMDVALVIDTSSSMGDPAGAVPGTKLDAAVKAVEEFLDVLNPRDHAGLVAFDATARIEAPLTSDRAAVRAALHALVQHQGTAIDLGLQEAATLLSDARPDATHAVILLTDGRQGGAQDPVLVRAAELKHAGAVVFTIGLGADVDAALLRSAATSSGHYYEAPDAGDLAAIYADIVERLPCGR